MARTQRLRRVGIILFATLVAVSIFLGNQRPAHASLATDIICLVYSELNIFGSPIPHLTADGCDAAPPTAGSGTLKVVKISRRRWSVVLRFFSACKIGRKIG